VSLFALTVSAVSLGWTIYRDVGLKPRAKVSVQKSRIVQPNRDFGFFVGISVTNFGPGPVNIEMIQFRRWRLGVAILKWLKLSRVAQFLRKSTSQGIITYDYTNQLSAQLPKKLEPGERISLLLPWDERSFLSMGPTQIGVSDSYKKYHWAAKSELKKVRAAWVSEFPEHDQEKVSDVAETSPQ